MSKAKRNVDDAYNSPFAVRIRQLIKDNNLTQTELAKKLGITRQAVNSYTLGLTVPNIDILCRIVETYHLSADYLLGTDNCDKTEDHFAFLCESTGLSKNALKQLVEYKDLTPCHRDDLKPINILDLFITSHFLLTQVDYITCFQEELINNTESINTKIKDMEKQINSGKFIGLDLDPMETVDDFSYQHFVNYNKFLALEATNDFINEFCGKQIIEFNLALETYSKTMGILTSLK